MEKQKLGLGMSSDETRIDELEKLNDDLEKRNEELEYIIAGIMHSVDKWLEGDEFMDDEVNRAATMRKKVLRIIEEKDRTIKELESREAALKRELKNTEKILRDSCKLITDMLE